MKKRWVLCLMMIFVLFLGTTVGSFGSVASASVGNTRLSNTKCESRATASFDGLANSCSVKITLQEKNGSTWRTATGVPVTSVIKNKTNTTAIALIYNFTLVSGKVYRTKVVFTDTRGSTTWTNTYYSSTF